MSIEGLSPRSKESLELFELFRSKRSAMNPNEEIWDYLLGEFASRMDVYQAEGSDHGYKFIAPRKNPDHDHITLYPWRARAELEITGRNFHSIILISDTPYAAIIQRRRRAGIEHFLHIFYSEKVDPAQWQLFNKRLI